MIEARRQRDVCVPTGRSPAGLRRTSGIRKAVPLALALVAGLLLSTLIPLLPAERPAGAGVAGPGALTGHRALVADVRSGPAAPVTGVASSRGVRQAGSAPILGSSSARRVWVQGDSVMAAAAGTVGAALRGDGWQAVVAGWPGLHLWAADDMFPLLRPRMGSVAVIELGDNDCCNGVTFGRDVDRAMRALAGMHVIWLTGTVRRPGQEATNDAIRAALRRWPNLEVADWAALVGQHPDTVFSDGVHLTPQGQSLMASFIRQRLDAWYRRAVRPPHALVRAYGRAPALGRTGGTPVQDDLVGGAATPDGRGCWLATADGGVFTFGDARFAGSAAGGGLHAPVVGMAATPDGGGYWLAGADGGVFTFGDARFAGSAAGGGPHAPVVGMAATPDGGGYWLATADGGVFTFGDARFAGSAAGGGLHAPVVGMAATPDGSGYWLVGADGGVFSFGSAPFAGSLGGTRLVAPIRSVAASSGRGYWLDDAAGRVWAFGDAPADLPPASARTATTTPPTVSSVIVSHPGGGYWLGGLLVPRQ